MIKPWWTFLTTAWMSSWITVRCYDLSFDKLGFLIPYCFPDVKFLICVLHPLLSSQSAPVLCFWVSNDFNGKSRKASFMKYVMTTSCGTGLNMFLDMNLWSLFFENHNPWKVCKITVAHFHWQKLSFYCIHVISVRWLLSLDELKQTCLQTSLFSRESEWNWIYYP